MIAGREPVIGVPKRRVWMAALIIALTGLALAACGEDAKPAPGDAETPPAEESVLIEAVSSEGAGLWPLSSWGLGFDVAWNTYDSLLIFDEGQVTPHVAESWDIADDGKRIVFHLREGISFSSGHQLTAKDVKWSFQLNRDCPGYANSDFPDWNLSDATAEVLDDRTLALNMPRGILQNTLPVFSTMYLLIYDSEELVGQTGVPADLASFNEEQCGKATEWLTDNIAGSGPYILESRRPGEELVLKGRDDYWGGKPYFDQVIYRVVPDPSTRFLLLTQGTVDVAWEIPAEKWPEIDGNPNLALNRGSRDNEPYFMAMDRNVEPFNDANFRKALIKAWPYETVVKDVTHGFGEVASGWTLPDDPAYEPLDLYSQDLGQARQFLEESSYTPGTSITLYVNGEDPVAIASAVWYQSALGEIGVPLEIQNLPTAQWTERRLAGELPFILDLPEPWLPGLHYLLRLKWYSQASGNFTGYSNPRFDEIVEEAQAIVDPSDPRALELLKEGLDIMVEEAPGAPLFFAGRAMPSKADIKGYYFPFYAPGIDLRKLSR